MEIVFDPKVSVAQVAGPGARPVVLPLTLPRGLFYADMTMSLSMVDDGAPLRESDALGVRGAFVAGVADRLELGAVVLPFSIRPAFEEGKPSVYGHYRFFDAPASMGIKLNATLPTQEGSSLATELGLTGRIQFTDWTRVDVAAHLAIEYSDPGQTRFRFPVQLTHNVTTMIALGLEGSVVIDNGRHTEIPFGVFFADYIQGAELPGCYLRYGLTLLDSKQPLAGFTIYGGGGLLFDI